MVLREFLPELRGQRGTQTWNEMARNEPIVGAILLAMEQFLKNVTWQVFTGSTKNEMLKAQNLITTSMNDMYAPFGHTVTELSSMFQYGWAAMEKVYKVRRGYKREKAMSSKYSDGMIGLAKTAPRAQETIYQWEFDESSGEAVGMWQYDMWDQKLEGPGRMLIPFEKCVRVRTTIKQDDPEGQSLLRTAYRPWFIKKNIEEIMVVGIERDLVGLPTIQPPMGLDLFQEQNTEILQHALDILVNVRNDEQMGVLVPADWTFTLVGSPGQKQFDLMEILDYYDKRIAVSMLGTFLLLGLERAGSMALASELKSTFMLAVKGWVTVLAEAFNSDIVDDLMWMNGMDIVADDKPQVIPGKIEDPNLDELSQYITRLVKVQALTPDGDMESMLRRFAGLTTIPQQEGAVASSRQTGMGGSTHVRTAPNGAGPGNPQMVENFRVVGAPRNTSGKNGSGGKGTTGNSAAVTQEDMEKMGMVRVGQEKRARFMVGVEDIIISTEPRGYRKITHLLHEGLLTRFADKTVSVYQVVANGLDGRMMVQEVERYHPVKSMQKVPENYADGVKTKLVEDIRKIEGEVDKEFRNGRVEIAI